MSSVPCAGSVWIWYQDIPNIPSEHCIFIKILVLLRNFKSKTFLRNIIGLYQLLVQNLLTANLYHWQVKWANGKRFEDIFVETLKKYGYKGSYMTQDWLKQPLFIQSFAPTSLIYISNLTDSPKILLIDDVTIPTQDTNQVFFPYFLERNYVIILFWFFLEIHFSFLNPIETSWLLLYYNTFCCLILKVHFVFLPFIIVLIYSCC